MEVMWAKGGKRPRQASMSARKVRCKEGQAHDAKSRKVDHECEVAMASVTPCVEVCVCCVRASIAAV